MSDLPQRLEDLALRLERDERVAGANGRLLREAANALREHEATADEAAERVGKLMARSEKLNAKMLEALYDALGTPRRSR